MAIKVAGISFWDRPYAASIRAELALWLGLTGPEELVPVDDDEAEDDAANDTIEKQQEQQTPQLILSCDTQAVRTILPQNAVIRLALGSGGLGGPYLSWSVQSVEPPPMLVRSRSLPLPFSPTPHRGGGEGTLLHGVRNDSISSSSSMIVTAAADACLRLTCSYEEVMRIIASSSSSSSSSSWTTSRDTHEPIASSGDQQQQQHTHPHHTAAAGGARYLGPQMAALCLAVPAFQTSVGPRLEELAHFCTQQINSSSLSSSGDKMQQVHEILSNLNDCQHHTQSLFSAAAATMPSSSTCPSSSSCVFNNNNSLLRCSSADSVIHAAAAADNTLMMIRSTSGSSNIPAVLVKAGSSSSTSSSSDFIPCSTPPTSCSQRSVFSATRGGEEEETDDDDGEEEQSSSSSHEHHNDIITPLDILQAITLHADAPLPHSPDPCTWGLIPLLRTLQEIPLLRAAVLGGPEGRAINADVIEGFIDHCLAPTCLMCCYHPSSSSAQHHYGIAMARLLALIRAMGGGPGGPGCMSPLQRIGMLALAVKNGQGR